jgi:hypothetical protein
VQAAEPGAASPWRAASGRWQRASVLLPLAPVSATVALRRRMKPRHRSGRRFLRLPGRTPVFVVLRAPVSLPALILLLLRAAESLPASRRERGRRRRLRLWCMAASPAARLVLLRRPEQPGLGDRRFRSRRRNPHEAGPSPIVHPARLRRRRLPSGHESPYDELRVRGRGLPDLRSPPAGGNREIRSHAARPSNSRQHRPRSLLNHSGGEHEDPERDPEPGCEGGGHGQREISERSPHC